MNFLKNAEGARVVRAWGWRSPRNGVFEMDVAEADRQRYVFGDFRLDPVSRQLLGADGTPVALTPRVFDTLLYLVQNAGVVVGKEAMIAAIWPNRVVEENNLTQNISALRRLFGENPGDHRYIVTEPGLGYRFVAPVSRDDRLPAAPGAERGGDEPPPRAHAKSDEHPAAATAPSVPVRARWIRAASAVSALLIVVAAAAALWPALSSHRAARPATAAILAVLPFKPLLAGPRNEVLELGMADTLIAKLSTNRHAIVRSLNAVRRFDRADQDPIAAGTQLGVASVLEGHIQRDGERVRLNARLLAVPDGRALWSGTFDAKFTDVFAVQDAIVQQVAAALSLQIDRDERRRMAATYTTNIEAYQLYLDGRYHLQNATPPELEAGIRYFQRALELDPAYALAYVGLAEGYRRQVIISDADPHLVLPPAKAAALHALRIDDTLAEAYVPLGFVSFWYEWDWATAEAQFKRGIDLQPNFADAHFGYAALLSNLGRHDEALRESRRARELDPALPLYVALEASFVANAGHAEEARRQVEGVLRTSPKFWIAHLVRGWLNADGGRYGDAAADFKAASELSGGSQQATSMLGFALARDGRRKEAQVLLDSLLERAQRGYIPPTSIATIYCGLGDNDQALGWLERGYDARDVRMTFLKVDRRWDALRADPRFVAIARKMGLQ